MVKKSVRELILEQGQMQKEIKEQQLKLATEIGNYIVESDSNLTTMKDFKKDYEPFLEQARKAEIDRIAEDVKKKEATKEKRRQARVTKKREDEREKRLASVSQPKDPFAKTNMQMNQPSDNQKPQH